MQTFRFIIWVVAAVLLTVFSVLGFVTIFFDTKDTLGSVAIRGLTWLELAFAVSIPSFWAVVVTQYVRLRKCENRQPKLNVLPATPERV